MGALMTNPRIRDLPCSERQPFTEWLSHWFKSRPIDDVGEPESEWDWYYQSDYREWKGET